MNTRKKARDLLKEKLPTLVKKIQEGDEESRETFASLLLPYLKTILYKYNSTIGDDIESVAGLVITKLLNDIHIIDTNKSVISFIERVAVNKTIDTYRSYTKNKANDTIEYQAYREYDTEYTLTGMSTDTTEDVEKALYDMLDDKSARVISRYYLDNVSMSDIAELYGYKKKDVENIISNARQNVKRAIS